jgi:hypothetical protein
MFVTNWTKGSEHATMGSMSASDAAPLPRLGEVFFDVRGSSRSMRLSWYADTGISVFSIWQGGTCTGTFRLPQEELPRLIDALQRGMYPDPRGTGGMARQFPGAPTDPRLTALPGYAGREADFTGPVTGDFRALRADDPAGTIALGSAARRALPPGGGYSDQPRYADQGLEPARYAEPGYAQPAQYADQAGYTTQPQYPDRAYSDQGYQERYDPQGSYGAQGYGYGEPTPSGLTSLAPSYSGQQYDSGAYPGQGGQGVQGVQGVQGGQGYDDRGYQQQAYQERGYQQDYGYAEQGNYRGQEVQQDHPERGYGQHAYPENVGQHAAPDRGYDQYGYSGQHYRDQGYAGQEQAYSGYDYAGDHRTGGYDPASYNGTGQNGAAYNGGGYNGTGYDAGSYDRAGYESGGYPNRGHDGSPGYDSPGYGGSSYEGAGGYGTSDSGSGYAAAGYGAAGYNGSGNGGTGYDSASYDGAGYDSAGCDGGSSRSGGYRQVPAENGTRDRGQYDDPDVTPSEPMSSFPYDGGPSREHRRRRRR